MQDEKIIDAIETPDQTTEVSPFAEQNTFIDSIVEKVNEDKGTYWMYCPAMNTPSGGIGTLLKMAKILTESGKNVKVAYEPRIDQKASIEASRKAGKQTAIYEVFFPQWVEFDITGLNLVALGDQKITLTDETTIITEGLKLEPEDYLIIPEGFPDLMQKTMQTPCKRIVLSQSWFYILNALSVGQQWQDFGIYDVISISNAITDYLNSIMPGLNIKQYAQSINRDLFKTPEKKSDKYPTIGYYSNRGPETSMKVFNIIKTFYKLFPHLKWVRAVDLSSGNRKDYANKLASCSVVLVTDDIAGFGTLPLEAMACGTHVVGWTNFGGKEYITKDNGFWTNPGDIFQTAEMLGLAVEKVISGDLDDSEKINEIYQNTLSKYTPEQEQEQILEIFKTYKNERIQELNGLKK